MRYFSLLICLSLTLNTQLLVSQTQMTLSLEKSVDIALKNNPQYKIAEKETEKAGVAVWEAYSAILPQVDLSANFQHAWEIQKTKIHKMTCLAMQTLVTL